MSAIVPFILVRHPAYAYSSSEDEEEQEEGEQGEDNKDTRNNSKKNSSAKRLLVTVGGEDRIRRAALGASRDIDELGQKVQATRNDLRLSDVTGVGRAVSGDATMDALLQERAASSIAGVNSTAISLISSHKSNVASSRASAAVPSPAAQSVRLPSASLIPLASTLVPAASASTRLRSSGHDGMFRTAEDADPLYPVQQSVATIVHSKGKIENYFAPSSSSSSAGRPQRSSSKRASASIRELAIVEQLEEEPPAPPPDEPGAKPLTAAKRRRSRKVNSDDEFLPPKVEEAADDDDEDSSDLSDFDDDHVSDHDEDDDDEVAHEGGPERAKSSVRNIAFSKSHLQLRLSPGDPYAAFARSTDLDTRSLGLLIRVKKNRKPNEAVAGRIVGIAAGSFAFNSVADFHYNLMASFENPEAGPRDRPDVEQTTCHKGMLQLVREPGGADEVLEAHEFQGGIPQDFPADLIPRVLPPPLFSRGNLKQWDLNRKTGIQRTGPAIPRKTQRITRAQLGSRGSILSADERKDRTAAVVDWEQLHAFHTGREELECPVPTEPAEYCSSAHIVDMNLYERTRQLLATRPMWTFIALRAALSASEELNFAPAKGSSLHQAVVLCRNGVNDDVLRHDVLPRLCYQFRAGPWRKCYVRLGFDPCDLESSGHHGTPPQTARSPFGLVDAFESRTRWLQVIDFRQPRFPGKDRKAQKDRLRKLAEQALARATEEEAALYTVHLGPHDNSAEIRDVVAVQLASEGRDLDSILGWHSAVQQRLATFRVASDKNVNYQLCDLISGHPDRDDEYRFGELDECHLCTQGLKDREHPKLSKAWGWMTDGEVKQGTNACKTLSAALLQKASSSKRTLSPTDFEDDPRPSKRANVANLLDIQADPDGPLPPPQDNVEMELAAAGLFEDSFINGVTNLSATMDIS